VSRARRSAAILVGAVVAGAGAVVLTTPDWLLNALAARYPGCLYRVPTRDRLLALTLDDGPDQQSTPLILAELRRHGARATFFLISGNLRNRGQLAHAIVRDGHELGNHFTRDRPSLRLTGEEFEDDLLQAHAALSQFGHIRWARPGSGWYSQEMVRIMQRNGYAAHLDRSTRLMPWFRRYPGQQATCCEMPGPDESWCSSMAEPAGGVPPECLLASCPCSDSGGFESFP
jgi:peptidoglycan/xylan/chitin deacetylase (PgdA/CDA1 family)